MVFFIWICATSGVLKRIPQEKPSWFLHHPSFLSPTKLAVSQLKSINFIGAGADPSNYSQAPRYWKWWSLLSCWDPQRWNEKLRAPKKIGIPLEFGLKSCSNEWRDVPLDAANVWPTQSEHSSHVCANPRPLWNLRPGEGIGAEETWWVEEFEQNSCFASEIPGIPTVNLCKDPTWKL